MLKPSERTALSNLLTAIRNCSPDLLDRIEDEFLGSVKYDNGDYAPLTDALVDTVAEMLDPTPEAR